jgi:hypothetical protein
MCSVLFLSDFDHNEMIRQTTVQNLKSQQVAFRNCLAEAPLKDVRCDVIWCFEHEFKARSNS